MRIPLRLSIETTVPTSKLTHLHVCTTKLPLTPPSPPFRTATCYGKYPDGNSSNTKEFVLCPSPRPTAIAEQAGMASPLLDPRNSHHPTSLPDIVITPPSPLPSQLSGPSKAFASERDATAIINGMTLVSAWPRPGTSLNELIFDHIGQQHLSPRDMRGRMMMPSPLLFKGQRQ
ncbi:hypothetical protein EV182_002360 [Spiromyces aspiralis]|uniref:Uncharacterized protein n=1 Tax=Spiromyces aspiralis TaxID=68401 RepID=A0ACC1HEJ1_9FUNG|nr:hypothetical protein EV182_002360 [Spiromyces aspiralis]